MKLFRSMHQRVSKRLLLVHLPFSRLDAYSVIDNDLARDNLENDITAADLQDSQ